MVLALCGGPGFLSGQAAPPDAEPKPPGPVTVREGPYLTETPFSGSQTAAYVKSDDPNGETVSYALTSGEGDTDNAQCSLRTDSRVPGQMELRMRTPLDYETKPVVSVRIRATDPGGLWTESVLKLQVTNVAEQDIRISPDDGATTLVNDEGVVNAGIVDVQALHPATLSFTVGNTGAMPLTISQIRLAPGTNTEDFELDTTGFVYSHETRWTSSTFTVRCHPRTNGLRTGTVEVLSNADQDPAFRIHLQVNGAVPAGGTDLTWGAGVQPGSSKKGGGFTSLGTWSSSFDVADAEAASDGALFTAGTTIPANSGSSLKRIFVTKLRPDGQIDSSFGTGGTATVERPGMNESAGAVACQADGSVLVAGTARPTSGNTGAKQIFVRRLTSAGLMDTLFAPEAATHEALLDLAAPNDARVTDLAVQADGKIVVLATVVRSASLSSLLVLRFTDNGEADSTFGSNGAVWLDHAMSYASDELQIRADGRLRLTGTRGPQSALQAMALQLNGDGSLDLTFGTQGVVTSDPVLANGARPASIHAEDDGRLLFASSWRGSDGLDRARFRALTKDGKPNPAFNQGREVVLAPNPHLAHLTNSLTRTADGRILAGALEIRPRNGTFTTYDQAVTLLRLRPDGGMDQRFSHDGRDSASLFYSSDYAVEVRGVRRRPDGKLLVFGQATRYNQPCLTFWAAFDPGPPVLDVPPEITMPPQSKTVDRNATTDFTVQVAPGNELTPWFRWRRQGVEISDPVKNLGARLHFDHARPEDEGEYTVEAGNQGGSVMAAFTLTVFAPPVVTATAQPRSYTGPENGTCEFTVGTEGRLPMTFQWRKDGVDYGPPVVSESRFQTLSVPAVKANEGSYLAIITNADGTTVCEAARLAFAPVLTYFEAWDSLAGEDQLPPGVVASFAAVGPVKVQWQKDGRNYGPASTETDSSETYLSPPNVTSSTGSYRCVISNAYGKLVTPWATVHVWNGVAVRQDQPRRLVQEGKAIDLSATIFDRADRAWDCRWTFNGVPMSFEDDLSLRLTDATFANAGSYVVTCRAGSLTRSSNAASVAVVEANGRTVSAGQGQPFDITVRAVGDGLSYHWRRADPAAPPLSPSLYSGIDSATLHVASYDAAVHESAFACEVTRSGCNDRATVVLSVRFVPEAPELAANATLPAGSLRTVYQHTLEGGDRADHFQVTGLPAGLACDAATGQISGIPRATGVFPIKITASNAAGTSATVIRPLTVNGLDKGLAGSFSGVARTGYTTTAAVIGRLDLTVTPTGTYTARLVFARRMPYSGKGSLHSASFTGLWKRDAEEQPYQSQSSAATIPTPGLYVKGSTRQDSVNLASDTTTASLSLTWSDVDGLQGTLDYDEDREPSVVEGHLLSMKARGAWNARTHPATVYAKYFTAEITQRPPFAAEASGLGYAAFTPSLSGTFTLAGRLPDGTAYTAPAFLTDKGTATAFTWLYEGAGQLLMDLEFDIEGETPAAAGVAGQGRWERPESPHSVNTYAGLHNAYFDGLTTLLNLQGAPYLKPNIPEVTGPLMLGIESLEERVPVSATGANLQRSIESEGTVTARHTLKLGPSEPRVPGGRFISLVFNPVSGLFSGEFEENVPDPDSDRMLNQIIPFRGITVYSRNPSIPPAHGSGFFTRRVTYAAMETINGTPQVVKRFPILVSGAVKIY